MPFKKSPFVLLLTVLAVFGAAAASGSPVPIWTDFDEALLDPAPGTRTTIPDAYRTVALDLTALQAVLGLAPLEFTDAARPTLALPMPDGSLAGFLIEESPIMEPLLAARYPLIKTYRGRGVDDPTATTRFGLTARGFHAIILSSSGTVFIDPYSRGDVAHYISYYKRDVPRDPSLVWTCDVHGRDERVSSGGSAESTAGAGEAAAAEGPAALAGTTLGDSVLRTYRLAQAANFEYTLFHSTDLIPSKADAINFGIIPTINRVNGIYERDLSAHLNLINDLEVIVWDTPADPYTNESGQNMLVENQVTIDTLIGPENYDIGHVFSTGGGGVAFLRSLCDDAIPSLKAGGVTGLPAPTGDVFSVDFVAHEIGHQFGGNHTFNGSTGNCAGGNRNGSTAYEVGSGSTIQAYAGICSPQNLQSNSDDYFHLVSYIEMRNHMNSAADGCAAKTATGNTPPTVEAGPDFVIPKQTPFTLTAAGSDADGDALTYAWEQFDLGPAGDGNTDNGSSPIFRSLPPKSDPSRTFPRLSDLLANTSDTYDDTTYGEILPTTNRTLDFRVSARDNRAGHGELTWDAMQVRVAAAAGPFTVVQPDGGELWTGAQAETVVWDVANTDAAPVSAAAVDIYLSTDGGSTFPILVAGNVPNTGTATVVAPNIETSDARIKVEGAGNVFFDVSNEVFSIQPGSGGTPFAADDAATTDFETGVLIDVLANDSDPDGDPLTIVAVQSPTDQGGTAVESAGQVLYTPMTGFAGSDSFTYTISDGTETAVGTVSVEVEPLAGCDNQPAAFEVTALEDGFAPVTGDGDPFIDNCENASLSFLVANAGGPDLTNVRIVDIRPVSHPDVTIETALPAAVAASIATSCDPSSEPATGTFNFTASGLSRGDTVLFEVDLTSDELAPFTRTFNLQLSDAENDVTVSDVTFDFEADENGWQVVQGSFLRLAPGADATAFSMQSSAGLDDACDLVRSPVVRLSASSTLTLFNQYAIEPSDILGFYDRANVGLYDPAANLRTVVAPDGGANPYNVPDGEPNGGCAAGQPGWADQAAPFAETSWSPSALGVAGLGPAGREFQLDVLNSTDASLALAGIQFDQVVITNVLELVPDGQPDDLCQISGLVAQDDAATTPEDTPVTIDVLANDSDPSAEFLVVQSVTQAANGTVTNNGGDVTYAPDADFNGADSFTYEVCNPSGDCAVADVSVTVTAVNDAPAASQDSASTFEDVPVVIDVLANDSDPEGDPLAVGPNTDASSAEGGTVANNGFDVTYTPPAGFNGTDSFVYEACDDGSPALCDTATVLVTVRGDDGPCDGCGGRVHGSGHLNVHLGPDDDEDSDTDADSDSDDDSDSEKIHFSFDAKYKKGDLEGKLKLHDKALDIKIVADKDGITSLTTGSGDCNGQPVGPSSWEFTAAGTFEQGDVETSATFRVCGEDNGKPGKGNDRFYLECTSGCSYDTGSRVPDDVIDGGNIHIHDAIAPEAAPSGGSFEGQEAGGGRSSSKDSSAAFAEPDQEELDPATDVDVLELGPMLLDELPAGSVNLFVATLFTDDGLQLGAREVTLTWTDAAGVKHSAAALTDGLGVAAFAVTVPAGGTELFANVDGLQSNGVYLTGTQPAQ